MLRTICYVWHAKHEIHVLLFAYCFLLVICLVLYTNIDQTLVNSLQGLMNCEIGGLDTKLNYIKSYYKGLINEFEICLICDSRVSKTNLYYFGDEFFLFISYLFSPCFLLIIQQCDIEHRTFSYWILNSLKVYLPISIDR